MTYSDRFLTALKFVLAHETVFAKGHAGDYAHAVWEQVSGDAGGVTKFGIDQRSHPTVDIKGLTMDMATQIYWLEYWVPCGAEHMPAGYGEVLFDIRVNGGDGPRLLQRGLNALGAGLTVDGSLGPFTLAAMTKYGEAGLRAFIGQRQARFETLAQKPGQGRFLAGWTARNADLARWLLLS